MSRVLIIPQYDVFVTPRDVACTITGFVVALDYGGFRLPVAECERLEEARREAKELRREYRAAKVSVEMEGVA